MSLRVIINPSRTGVSAKEFAVFNHVDQTLVFDEDKSWAASANLMRWKMAKTDAVLIKSWSVGTSNGLSELLAVLARVEESIEFFCDEAMWNRVSKAATATGLEVTDWYRGEPESFNGKGAATLSRSSSTRLESGAAGVGVLLVHIDSYEITNQCLESLSRTSYDRSQVYLLDNASGNLSAVRLFLDYPNTVVLTATARVSYTRSFNLLGDFAIRDGAEFLFLSNNDTRGHSLKIFEELVARIDGEIAMASPRVFDFNHTLLRDSVEKHFGVEFSLATEAYLVRSAVWSSLKGFTNDFEIYGEDIDLILRLRNLGLDGAYEPSVELEHLQNGTTGNRVFLRTYFYIRNVIWIQKRRNSRLIYSVLYYTAQESISILRWALHLARTGDFYPILSSPFYLAAGVAVGILSDPRQNHRHDLEDSISRTSSQLKYRIR